MRRLLACLGVATLLATLAPAAEAATAVIAWHPCDGQPAVDCATVPVPVDWTRPHGPTTGMAVARLKAAKPAQRKGVLVVNPGGPGGSGVGYVESIARNPRYQALADSFDIVGSDPRGVGASADIRCDSTVLNEPVELVPTTREQYRNLLAHNDRVAANCRRLNGPLFNHVDTVSVVRDMDLLRTRLGEAKISYYGVSYGTQIGQQYLERYGHNLRAIVLDSNMDHSIGATRYEATAALAFENSFKDFASWCQRTPSCSLHGQDVLALWDSLYAKASAGTLPDTSPADLRDIAFGAMYHPATAWFALADSLKRLAAGAPTLAPPPADTEDNSYQAIWCSDWTWPSVNNFSSLSALRATSEAVAPHTHFSDFFSDVTSCLGWTGPLNNPQHVLQVRNAPPVLMTNGIHDVATPYEWALNVATQISTARLLTYDGTGHGDYGNSLCARDAINAYLLDLRLPARGTHCAAEWPTTPPAADLAATGVAKPVHAG
ncbi:MAG TPA: alpha/beta hydrolase [Kutzneria sp.]